MLQIFRHLDSLRMLFDEQKEDNERNQKRSQKIFESERQQAQEQIDRLKEEKKKVGIILLQKP